MFQTMKPSALSMRIGVLLAAVLAGCSDAPRANGVTHLDPRLENGDSSAEVLASIRRVIHSWEVESPESDLGPWSFHEPFVSVPARSGPKGMLVGDKETEPGVFPRLRLSWKGSIGAHEFNVLELDLKKYHRSGVRLAWKRADDPPNEPVGRHGVDLTFDSTQDIVPVQIALEGHPEWRGQIVQLTFTPCTEGPQRIELAGMRFVQVGFSMGFDPLREEFEPRPSADGGLIAVGTETRRAWPSDWNVPLFARTDVPRGGTLSVDTAIPGPLAGLERELVFAVDVRTRKSKWIEIAERRFVPRDEESPTDWEPLLADLSPWESETVEVRLRNYMAALEGEETGGAEEGLGGELATTRAYWGNPIVTGDLPDDRRPNIVIVTLDTLRADRFGVGLMPFTEKLGEDAIVYENAWTACNSTSPSHASILTGVHVQDHGVLDNFSMLAPGNIALAELMREAGYHTAAAVSVRHLQTGCSGLGQGMDQFLLSAPRSSVNGGITLTAVQAWLQEWRDVGDRPFFLWVHFFDPHTPYGPPEDYLEELIVEKNLVVPPKSASTNEIPESQYTKPGAFLHEVTSLDYAKFLYDTGVTYTDMLVAELVGELKELDLYDETALFITADHGESLGEHQHYFHHTDLYQDTMHVPLIARIPGAPRGVRVTGQASTLDIASTVRDLLGLDQGVLMRGENLLDLARSNERGQEIRFAHSHLQQLGLVTEQDYFIATVADYEQLGKEFRIPKGTRELYDRMADPELLENVAGEQAGKLSTFESKLKDWQSSAKKAESRRRALTDEELAELERLGYTDVRDE